MDSQIDILGFEKYWRRRKPGSSTAIHYASDVRIFFRWTNGLPPEAVTVHDIDAFIEWQLLLGRAPATIQRRLVAVRMFYDYLAYMRNEEISNPIIPQRHYIHQGRRLPREISEADVQQLFAAIGDHLRDHSIFTLMLHAGLRVGEVVKLRVGDLYLFEKRSPYLRLTGKGQRQRVVYLSTTSAKLLRQYLTMRPPDSDERIFLNLRGRPITVTGIQLQLAKYCRQAGVWVTCHQLRHTYACRMIAAGVPITSLQKLLGHASLRTTQLYVHVADRQVERDYQAGIQQVMMKLSALAEGSYV